MKKLIATIAALAASVSLMASDCPKNLGQLTSSQIAAGFEQGPHSSSFAGEPRVGLANIVEQGNLKATLYLIVLTLGLCSV